MIRWTRGFICALLAMPIAVPAEPPTTPAVDDALLGFEAEPVMGTTPGGWSGFPPATIASDPEVKHGGAHALRLTRDNTSSGEFSSVLFTMPIDFKGATLELRGWLRREGAGVPSLWMRQDDSSAAISFVDMRAGPDVATEWGAYSISFKLDPNARSLVFGVRLVGNGKAWADDLELLVDGKPWASVEHKPRDLTVIERDREFDGGSKIALNALDDRELDALVLTTKVWGFLKYHALAVTSGQHHWDYDLFRHLPAILAATDRDAVERELVGWIDSLGVLTQTKCTAPPSDAVMKPRLAWIEHTGQALRAKLRAVHSARNCGQQFFVSLAPGVGNPVFDNEPVYGQIKLPDAGYQLLAVMRFWNMVEYWFPYRDLIDEDWDVVLRDALPRVALAHTSAEFEFEMAALFARADDSHANLWSAVVRRPPAGACALPVSLRFVEGKIVVKRLLTPPEQPTPFRVGDVVSSIDGVPVADTGVADRRYYGASNERARQRDIARALIRGECGAVRVRVVREAPLDVDAQRVDPKTLSMNLALADDRPGETFQKLSEDVAYLKLSSIKAADVPKYLESAAGAKALIVDIRGYPSDFVVFALGAHLVEKAAPFARFTQADLSNPGAFGWGAVAKLEPQEPRFGGRVVILVDELSMSQAEYTAMALRASPRAIVVGSGTTGADGNISNIPLSAGLRGAFTGIGVFYPDRAPTQQVGVRIDVRCEQTIAGIREGRDEILECALRELQ